MTEKKNETTFSITPGRLLVAAREARSLSQVDIAKQLRLSVQAINALEDDDYAYFGVRTFVRGYLSSYARIVNIPEKQVLDAMDSSGLMSTDTHSLLPRIEGAPVLNVTHQRSSRFRNSRYSRLVLLGVSVLLLIGIVVWMQGPKDATVKSTEVKTKTTPLAFSQPDTVVHSDDQTATTMKSTPVALTPDAESTPAPVVHVARKAKKNHVESENTATPNLHPTYVVTPASGSATQ